MWCLPFSAAAYELLVVFLIPRLLAPSILIPYAHFVRINVTFPAILESAEIIASKCGSSFMLLCE